MVEQGMPDYLVDGWFAVIGPAKLPAATSSAFTRGSPPRWRHPKCKEAMAKQGNVIKPSTPEAAVAFFRTEQDKYAKLVQKAGVKID